MATTEVTITVSSNQTRASLVLPDFRVKPNQDPFGPLQLIQQGSMTVTLPVTYNHAIARRNWDRNCDGKVELYRVPVYQIYIDAAGKPRQTWHALRFMPAWIDNNRYRGFTMASPAPQPRRRVPQYKPNYLSGAIVIKGGYYIHKGPKNLNWGGWNGRGCVEMVGDFKKFLGAVLSMSAITRTANIHDDMKSLVKSGKLFVKVDPANKPALVIDRQTNPPQSFGRNAPCVRRHSTRRRTPAP
ncbi:MAG: hypothetical protein R3C19_26905 [Planctomycetaceae bacterium]